MKQDILEQKIKAYLKRAELTQASVARKLHYGPDRFNKWLKGTNRIPDEVIEELAKLLNLTETERAELFQLAGYVAINQLGPIVHSIPIAPTYLPPKTYTQLIGREAEFAEIINVFNDSESQRIVALIGLGGMGKTALAYEVANYCQQQKLFEYIVWRSAKVEHFESERIARYGQPLDSFDELLNDIGRQCGRLDITQLAADQKKMAVRGLLANRRVLIVLDNLETVADNEQLVSTLFQILGQSRLLITSRHQLKHEGVYLISLGGLSQTKGVDFLRVESNVRNIQEIAEAKDEPLLEIQQVTGGAPLAMKLVVGQLSRQPLSTVLTALKKATRRGPDYEFYRFVFWYSWGLLSEDAQGALVDLSVFPPITGGTVQDVEAISQVESDRFWAAIGQLVLMSLVDKIGALGQERFALHPLTHYFVLSDVTEEWQ